MEWMSNQGLHVLPFTAMQKHFRRHGVIRRTMVIFPLVRPVYQEQLLIPMPILATSAPFLLASRSLLCDSLRNRDLRYRLHPMPVSDSGSQKRPTPRYIPHVHNIQKYTLQVALNLCPRLHPSDSAGSFSASFLRPPLGDKPKIPQLPLQKKTVRLRMLRHHRTHPLPPQTQNRQTP